MEDVTFWQRVAAFVIQHFVAIALVVIVWLRTSKFSIMLKFDEQNEKLKKQEELLTEQNMTLLRIVNKVEAILDEKHPEKSEKMKSLFQKQEKLLEDQNSLLKGQTSTLANMSDRIEALLKK